MFALNPLTSKNALQIERFLFSLSVLGCIQKIPLDPFEILSDLSKLDGKYYPCKSNLN